MFSSIKDVKGAFYELFSTPIPIAVLGKDTTINVPGHFEGKSGQDFTEQDPQNYPCIVIQDYAPELSKEWGTPWEEYQANARDTNDDGIVDTVTVYPIPKRFLFRFDVSIVAKKYNQYISMEDWMAQTFQWSRTIILNEVSVPINSNGDTTEVGVPVGLAITPTRLTRPDGIFDTNYEMSFETNLYFTTTDEETIQTLNITFAPQPMPTMPQALYPAWITWTMKRDQVVRTLPRQPIGKRRIIETARVKEKDYF